MKCVRCGNENPLYFYKGSKGWYCRCCVRFKRQLLEEDEESRYEVNAIFAEPLFQYPLTVYQKKVIYETAYALKNGQNVCLHCVTGAGKTEIATVILAAYASLGKKVCYAIPRREVVIELLPRFQKMLPGRKIVAVYGGHHDELYGDLIVCTTHQLYRYRHCFDLLVIDEADAFPFAGNAVLNGIALNSVKGRIIYSTATPRQEWLNDSDIAYVFLPLRPHGKPLVEPRIHYSFYPWLWIQLYFAFKRENHPLMVFCPTKKSCRFFYSLYRPFFNCTYAYSDSENREESIHDFKTGKRSIIFATSILERGITVNNCNVIILDIRKGLLQASTLIQMAGRAGRNFLNPVGKVDIYCLFKDQEALNAQKEVRKANEQGLSLLRKNH